MSDEPNYSNSPLHGLSLKNLLIEIVDHYGFEILFAYLNINCFKTNASIESSVKFLKKTDWAREKVEAFYLYEFKSLPRASTEQFALPPRDRVIPDEQTPGEPAVLSLEDAARLREKRARKAAERGQKTGHRSFRDKKHDGQRKTKPAQSGHNDEKPSSPGPTSSSSSSPGTGNAVDPWANAKKLRSSDK